MLKPMKDLIHVKPVVDEYEGLVVVSNPIEDGKAAKASVVAVGPDCEEIKPGDVILHKVVTGLEFKFEGETYIAMHEPEVLAVVE